MSEDTRTPTIAIVTGATSGLGLEFARQIDQAGECDEIWLVARNEHALAEVARSLKARAVPVPADLSKPADVATIAALLEEEQLTVRYLVNAAGFGRFGAWDEIDEADAEAMIDLNCKGVVMMTNACLPYLARGSRVIEVASAAGFLPLPYMNVYAATKAFVLRYTRALRWELHGSGITVTALCPTWVKTGFEEQARKSRGERAVNHLLLAQTPHTVVARALTANKLHCAVSSASILSLGLRLVGKVFPNCISMAGWNLVRRL